MIKKKKKKKVKKPDLATRSYPQKCLANPSKIASLWALLLLYRRDSEILNQYQKRLFFQDFKVNKNAEKKDSPFFQDYLGTERFRETQQYQVVYQIDSYLERLKKEFTKIVFKTFSDDNLRYRLSYINKAGLWQCPPRQLKASVLEKLSPKPGQMSAVELFKLAKSIFKQLRKNNAWPTCRYWMTMALDAKVAIISSKGGLIGQSQKKGAASFADYWIQISTYTKGKVIQIPLETNDYFHQAPGRRSNNLQVHFNQDKTVKISFFRSKLKKLKNLPQTAKFLDIDCGLNCQIATNYGDLLGQDYKKQLDYYDDLENNLKKELKRRNKCAEARGDLLDVVPIWDNHRLQNLSRIRTEYIKNETGRNTNKLISIHHPDILRSEDLDWQESDLDAQMNRHLHRYGQGVMEHKINCFIEDGLLQAHQKKNPAYTSQRCFICGYVDKTNRSNNRDIFICRACFHKAHADCNGSGNVGIGSSNLYASKEEILKDLVASSITRLSSIPLSQESLTAILKNPYYSDYHQDFQGRLRKGNSKKAETSSKGKSLSLEKGSASHLAKMEHWPSVEKKNTIEGDAIIVGFSSSPQLTLGKQFS